MSSGITDRFVFTSKDHHAIINENFSATRIIKDVNVLMVIQWVQQAWKKTVGVDKSKYDLMKVEEDDLAFEVLVREFSLSLYA